MMSFLPFNKIREAASGLLSFEKQNLEALVDIVEMRSESPSIVQLSK